MPFRPEISGASIVLVGNFNPLIFRPDWFVQKGILAEEEVDAAVRDGTINLIHPEIIEFNVPSFTVNVERTKFQVKISQEPLIAVFDMVHATFRALPETPISAIGINRIAHFPLGTEEKWHALGDILTPKEPWEFLLHDDENPRPGGLRSLKMERSRRPDDREGHIQVTIEPSVSIPNGVYVYVNDHYKLSDVKDPVRSEVAIELLNEIFEGSMKYSTQIIEHIAGLSDV